MRINKLRTLWLLCLGGFLFFSCDTEKSEKILKIGTKGLAEGVKKELLICNYKMDVLDTILLTNGSTEFQKTWEEPQIIYLYDKEARERFSFLSEEGKTAITLPFEGTNLKTEEIVINYATKSENLMEFQKFDSKIKSFTDEDIRLSKEWSELRKKYNGERIPQEARAGIDSAFIKFTKDKQDYFKNYIVENNNLVSQFICLTDLRFYNTVSSLEKMFAETPEELQKTVYYKDLKTKYGILKNLVIGANAPDIIHPDTLGNDLALSSLRGKYVLLDFWASWCGPCRKENPWVKKAYQRFQDRGFDVYAVSLDYPGQKDRWLDAIHKDELPWHHVSLLKGWKDPAVKQYNVSGIPSPFLLDPEGKIVAKGDDLREEGLIKILEKYLKK